RLPTMTATARQPIPMQAEYRRAACKARRLPGLRARSARNPASAAARAPRTTAPPQIAVEFRRLPCDRAPQAEAPDTFALPGYAELRGSWRGFEPRAQPEATHLPGSRMRSPDARSCRE